MANEIRTVPSRRTSREEKAPALTALEGGHAAVRGGGDATRRTDGCHRRQSARSAAPLHRGRRARRSGSGRVGTVARCASPAAGGGCVVAALPGPRRWRCRWWARSPVRPTAQSQPTLRALTPQVDARCRSVARRCRVPARSSERSSPALRVRADRRCPSRPSAEVAAEISRRSGSRPGRQPCPTCGSRPAGCGWPWRRRTDDGEPKRLHGSVPDGGPQPGGGRVDGRPSRCREVAGDDARRSRRCSVRPDRRRWRCSDPSQRHGRRSRRCCRSAPPRRSRRRGRGDGRLRPAGAGARRRTTPWTQVAAGRLRRGADDRARRHRAQRRASACRRPGSSQRTAGRRPPVRGRTARRWFDAARPGDRGRRHARAHGRRQPCVTRCSARSGQARAARRRASGTWTDGLDAALHARPGHLSATRLPSLDEPGRQGRSAP